MAEGSEIVFSHQLLNELIQFDIQFVVDFIVSQSDALVKLCQQGINLHAEFVI